MKHLLNLAMWTMLAGVVVVPASRYLLERKAASRRSPQSDYENWIKWWEMQNHPNRRSVGKK